MLHDNVLKRKLADGQLTHGLWVTLEAPTISEIGVELGIDWICVDAERLQVVGTAPRPPLQELTRDVAMPSAEWPSDHVSLCADLAWR